MSNADENKELHDSLYALFSPVRLIIKQVMVDDINEGKRELEKVINAIEDVNLKIQLAKISQLLHDVSKKCFLLNVLIDENITTITEMNPEKQKIK